MLVEEAAALFSRYSNDAALNQQQREAVRWEDPFAHLAQKKQEAATAARSEERDAALRRLSGFKVPLEVPAHSWINRKASFAPNRFGIKPGR